MRNKIKYVITFFCVIVLVIASINLFKSNKEQQLKGHIKLLVNSDSYDYLVECADNFMQSNDKTVITVNKIDDYNILKEEIINTNKMQSTITEINKSKFEELGLDDLNIGHEHEELIDIYSQNFSKYRIEQVKSEGIIMGVPLTSRPLGFFVREDLLRQYGYKRSDMNTWSDIIEIGKDIYEKSNHTIKIINATGQDYADLVDLLIMQNLSEDSTIEDIKLHVSQMIDDFNNNNILNLNDGGEFLARISSINAVKEIIAIEEKCEWSVGNVPSITFGSNKFFSAEGENLTILKEGDECDNLTQKFITYVLANNKDTIKYIKEGKFFSSYLNTYKNKETEDSLNNFVGTSPLVSLSNIEEKTIPLSDYDKYIKAKKEIMN